MSGAVGRIEVLVVLVVEAKCPGRGMAGDDAEGVWVATLPKLASCS